MPLLPVDKTKPPLLSGYRKLLALALGLVVIALFGIFAPDQVDSVGQWVVTLIGTYFGGNVANSIARSVKEAKAEQKGLPAPDESLSVDMPPPALPPS